MNPTKVKFDAALISLFHHLTLACDAPQQWGIPYTPHVSSREDLWRACGVDDLLADLDP